MADPKGLQRQEARSVLRFFKTALSLWRGRSALSVWTLTVTLVVTVLLQLVVQYQLNFWNRDFFDALSRKDSVGLWAQIWIFLPLAAVSIVLAVFSVWNRMTIQRKWREWLTYRIIAVWERTGRARDLKSVWGDHQNPEHRIAEDGRLATDSPIDLVSGFLSAVLTSVTFIIVLWDVGGNLVVGIGGATFVLHGYLVVAVTIYSISVALSMIAIGHSLVGVVGEKNKAEAEFRTAGTRFRELSESRSGGRGRAHADLLAAFREVAGRWRELCWQLMGTTFISQSSVLAVPVVAWILCAPKYLAGEMSLGEFTQAAAAFVAVQSSFSWFVDNYARLADWYSSAGRVGELLLALDALGDTEMSPDSHAGSSLNR